MVPGRGFSRVGLPVGALHLREFALDRVGKSGSIFDRLQNIGRGAGGEIQLTDGIAALLADEPVFAYRFSGKRYDCGSKLGYLKATVELGRRHPEIGDAFSEFLDRGAR